MNGGEDLDEESRFECARCEETKYLREFSPADQREWLLGKRYGSWVCFDCRFPLCVRCEEDPETVGKRPSHAVPHNALIDEKYYCPECRYPTCSDCGKAAPCTRCRLKIWFCRECSIEGLHTC